MNAHQRRVVRRATERVLRRTANRFDEREERGTGGRWAMTPAKFVSTANWSQAIEIAVRPKRNADSDRPRPRRPDALRDAVQRALAKVLHGWVRWSEHADVLVEQITIGEAATLLLRPVPLAMFSPGLLTETRTSFALSEDQRIRVDVRALPTTCGPVTIQMAATVVNTQGKTFLGGGLLQRLDPGMPGRLWHDALGPCRLVGVAFDWRPIEPWDRRLSRYLEMKP